MAFFKLDPVLLGVIVLFLFARPALAFGAGNIAGISSVEGQNWRHGDLEDTLLTILMARTVGGKKFDKIMVSRVYFGNWLRDYSQAIDVGTVKGVSAEAIRLLLCVLGFLTFGYGSREFEVTADRLGCYRPEDHIDNPKNYADNVDARQYDSRLRGPVDESVELAIDQQTGMKNYIANENINIMNSALHIRKLFTKSIELGRSYQQNKDKLVLYEALRLMGTGLHCLEDFLAHSNYTELALIELGEQDIFPHVGRNTKLRINGAQNEVYPVVTGTFGGVDFLHSVTGEVSDKMTQSEIEDLEGTLQQSKKNDTSLLRDLLDKVPSGLFGGDDKKQKMEAIQNDANSSQLENVSVSPKNPEEFTAYIQQVFKQIMPAIEFHDEILQNISAAISQIPILPKIVEQLEEQLSVFVFSVIAPFIIPVIDQIKNELATGATEVIESSKNEQHIVFNDDSSTDPTHSMLSKDHFSNILNEIAGRTASEVVAWTVPQLMEAWDDNNVDVDRLLSKIIYGVLHHPAQREQGENGAADGRKIMFNSVKKWWEDLSDNQKEDYRRKLSRDGVENGENHKEGVEDSGHGCGKPLGFKKNFGEDTMEDRIAGAAAGAIIEGVTGGFSDILESQTGMRLPKPPKQQQPSEEESGGFGGLLGKVAGGLFGGHFKKEETESYQEPTQSSYGGGRRQETTQSSYGGGRQEEQEETPSYGGGRRQEQTSSYGGGYGGGRQQEQQEEAPSYGGGRRQEQTSSYGGGYGGGRQQEQEEETPSYGGGRRQQREEEETPSYGGGRRQQHEEEETPSYGGGRRQEQQEETPSYGGGYGGGRRQEQEEETPSYGGGYGGGRRQEREEETPSYGGGRRQEEETASYGGGYGGGRRQEQEEETPSYGGGYGGGRREEREQEEETPSYGGYGGRRDDEESDERRKGW
ncbi:heterokaryon incompatibility protein Het-C-domain-containing protein [Podospora appendiculata]|uniref:Heterokaryon incompatibility protein Het-C-domain-containing protein n=1 Tax=Podospora appendiculata TaxID=314037 RepID=A0AAE1CGF4_9PEZI|nr:heterokaryon incompatibility protein Het-C-domain-containing protein [Podospora appendiculata]